MKISQKRMRLEWNGTVLIRTVPMTDSEREEREKNWRLAFPGNSVKIITE